MTRRRPPYAAAGGGLNAAGGGLNAAGTARVEAYLAASPCAWAFVAARSRSLLRRCQRDPGDADGVSAQAACEATAAFPGGGTEAYYGDYLKNAIFHALCRHFGYEVRRPTLDADLPADPAGGSALARVAHAPARELPPELAAQARDALARLAPRPRAVTAAYFGLDGPPESPAEIARRLHWPLARVRRTLTDALAAMRGDADPDSDPDS